MKKKMLIILLMIIGLTGCGQKDAVQVSEAGRMAIEDENVAEQAKQDVDDIIAQADALVEQGDIDSAISLISDALNSYPDYSDILSQKKASYKTLKQELETQLSEIEEELDFYMLNNDFATLFTTLTSFKENYPDLLDRLNEKEAEYIDRVKGLLDSWIMEADNYAVNLDFDSAHDKLNEVRDAIAMEGLPADISAYMEIITDRNLYYNTYYQHFVPSNLISKNQVFDGNYWFEESGASFNDSNYDRYGHFYTTFFRLYAANDQTSKVIFNAGGNYERFGASFVVPQTVEQDKSFVIEVYGDDVLLASYSGITSYDEPTTIEVDITGYKLINFKVYREDTTLYWKAPHLILYDANFYNVTPIDFEYYIAPENVEISAQ